MILLQETGIGIGSGSTYKQWYYSVEVNRTFYLYRPNQYQRLVTVLAIYHDHIHDIIEYKLLDYYTKEIIIVSRPYDGDEKDCEWELSCSGTSPDSDVVRFMVVKK
jgi:hypothetical protein